MGLPKGAKENGTGKNAPRHAGGTHVYEELVNGSDTRRADAPISRLAEQLAPDPIGFDWNAPRSDRMWTNRQAQLRLYKHRFFTMGQARAQEHMFNRVGEFLASSVLLVCPFICLVEPLAGP